MNPKGVRARHKWLGLTVLLIAVLVLSTLAILTGWLDRWLMANVF